MERSFCKALDINQIRWNRALRYELLCHITLLTRTLKMSASAGQQREMV